MARYFVRGSGGLDGVAGAGVFANRGLGKGGNLEDSPEFPQFPCQGQGGAGHACANQSPPHSRTNHAWHWDILTGSNSENNVAAGL